LRAVSITTFLNKIVKKETIENEKKRNKLHALMGNTQPGHRSRRYNQLADDGP